MSVMTEENRISIRKEIVSNLQQVIHLKCKQVRLQGYIYCLVFFVVTTGFLFLFSYSVCLHGQVECSENKQTE